MKRSQAGNAMIEFAGSLLLLGTLFSGVFEIGYSLHTYGQLVSAVRAGARYAALQPRGAANDPAVATAVRNFVVYGDPAPAPQTKPLVSGLDAQHVELINTADSSTVSIRGFTIDAVFMKLKLDGRPTVTFPATPPASTSDSKEASK